MYIVCELRMSVAVKTSVKVPIGTATVVDDRRSSWVLQDVTGGCRKLQIEQLRIIRRAGKIAKKTISFVISTCPSVRMEQLGSYWADFNKILYLNIFRKFVT